MVPNAFYRRLFRCALLMMALCMTVLCLSACIVIHNNFPPAENDLPPILPNDSVDPEQDVSEPSDLPDDTATEQPTNPASPENEQVAEQQPTEEEPAEQEPTEQESTESEPTESESESNSDTTVWISENGTKYHTSATCSGMKEPTSLPLTDAQQQGYTACKRCH